MLMISVILNLLVAAGLLAMGAKYVRAVPPMDYHAEIMSGASVPDSVLKILGGLYKGMGGAFLGMGAGLVLLTVFGVAADVFWAKLTILVMALISGALAAQAAKTVEDGTGVKTPWRIAAGLTGLAILAFLMSLI